MTPGSVLIGGGTGFIGSHVCRLFKRKGYKVTVVSRMPGPNHISWHELGDLGLPGNTVAVVNCAGQNVLDPFRRWTAGFKQNVWNSRVKTTAALAQAIIKSSEKPKAFVTMSGVGIYKPHHKTVYTESSRSEKFDFLSELCHEWEKAAQLPNDISTRQIVIRSGVVLGRDGGMIKQLYLPFYLGLGGPVASGQQYLPWIHVGDLARLIVFAVEEENITGILNAVAPQTITNQEFTKAFASALYRPAIFPLPEFVVNIIFSEERAQMLTRGQIVVPERAPRLGFEFVYKDIQSACQDIVKPTPDVTK